MNIGITVALTATLLAGCGEASRDERVPTTSDRAVATPPPPAADDAVALEPGDADEATPDAAVIRARWSVDFDDVGALGLAHAFESGTAPTPVDMTVPMRLTFTVDTTAFVQPEPVGIASYGKLVVTALEDNALSVCGPNADERCTLAAFRVYTTGAPGVGLWNAREGYGLPILTAGKAIRLDPAGARSLKRLKLNARRIVRLSDFVPGGGGYEIPIAVDFTNAGAGRYQSTLVVDYVVYIE